MMDVFEMTTFLNHARFSFKLVSYSTFNFCFESDDR